MTGALPVPRAEGAVRIELAEGRHGAALAALHGKLIDPPWSEESVLATLANPAAIAFVALGDAPGADAVDGFAIVQVAADEAEVLAIAVVPARRRQGLARRILAAAEAKARQCGACRIYLEVASDNAAARRLYAAAGYTETGRRPGYYRRPAGPVVDAVLLSRVLWSASDSG